MTIPPPSYINLDATGVINVKSVDGTPISGDGHTDDTESIKAIVSQYASSHLLFFPQGTYIITDTIAFPPGSRVMGEAWSTLSAKGKNFQDARNPKPMIQVGKPGDKGVAQFSDMLLTVAEVLPGCILLEVNMAGNEPGDVGVSSCQYICTSTQY